MNFSTTRATTSGGRYPNGTTASRRLRNSGVNMLLHRFFLHVLARDVAEADAFARHVGRAGIGRHDQDDVAEIDRLAVVIGQAAIVHHLQQDVEQVGVRLLDFVEQQHAVRVLVDRIGQQPALIIADIARRRADQAADRVAFHIFGHVEALRAECPMIERELFRDFGLADAGGAGEQISCRSAFRDRAGPRGSA